jgi:inorganic pyrophosphatase
MPDLNRLPNELSKEKRELKAVIETPKGRRNKFKYEPEKQVFSLSRVLPEGFLFPFDFGFIPSTKAPDGDPLDVVVLMEEPAHVGCVLDVRLIGVVKVVQKEGGKERRNDRLLAVAVQSFQFSDIKEVSEIRPSTLKQLTDFFALYNKDSGKQDEVEAVEGAESALQVLEQSS